MVTKKTLIIGGLALLGVGLLVHRASAATKSCGKGTTLTRMTLAEARAKYGAYQSWPQIEAQVKSLGGVCLAQGVATDAGTKPAAEPDDMPDQIPITHPWQLV